MTPCSLANNRVCLGRATEGRQACVFCIRAAAREEFRLGRIDFEQFRSVLAETNGDAR